MAPEESEAEASLLEPRHRVFAKVRLGDLVKVVGGRGDQGAFNRVSQKHVDFVVCDAESYAVLWVIEVDDATHQRSDRVTSDATKDAVLGRVGIPLIRVPARRTFRAADVEPLLRPFLAGPQVPMVGQSPAVQPADSQGPISQAGCPRCGQRLVERTAKTGSRFIGCSGFPSCRYTANVA